MLRKPFEEFGILKSDKILVTGNSSLSSGNFIWELLNQSGVLGTQ